MAELISIITPVFNAQQFIYRAVSSAIAQTYPDWEMIIVAGDDFDYKRLLRSRGVYDPRVRYLSFCGEKLGLSHARNLGLSAAHGAWIAPLDADDVFYPSRLSILLSAAQATGLALDNGIVVDDAEENSRALLFKDKKDSVFRFTDYQKTQVPLLFFLHRSLADSGWNTDVEFSADTLFNLRALEQAGSARFISRPLHEHRVHNQSLCYRLSADNCFDSAYVQILRHLQECGLGFSSPEFRNLVSHYFEEKRLVNQKFKAAIAQGYRGHLQQFVMAQV